MFNVGDRVKVQFPESIKSNFYYMDIVDKFDNITGTIKNIKDHDYIWDDDKVRIILDHKLKLDDIYIQEIAVPSEYLELVNKKKTYNI